MTLLSKLTTSISAEKTGSWGDRNPLWWPLVSWLLTLGGFSLGEVLIRSFGWGGIMRFVIAGLVITAAIAPFAAFVMLAAFYKRNSRTLSRIVCLYIALLLLCANINFLLMLHFGRGGSPPFHGIRPAWGELLAGQRSFHWDIAFLSIVDCLHFSVATLSTTGFGDMYPTTWYSKLVVDVEMLMGLGLTVLTVGRYFSSGAGDNSDSDR
ncbi:MAG TPA: potassium channel family protein [Pyrinomonadaceae bacterium]